MHASDDSRIGVGQVLEGIASTVVGVRRGPLDRVEKGFRCVVRKLLVAVSIGHAARLRQSCGGYRPEAGSAELANAQTQLALEIEPAEGDARKKLAEQIRLGLRSSVTRAK